jgi:hypothetical protein
MTERRPARPPVPPALYALAGVVLAALLVASAVTGQWAILVLGVVALGALVVPLQNRRR